MHAPAKNRGAAIDRYRGDLQQCLGLITHAQWIIGPTRFDPNVLFLTTNPDPIELRRGPLPTIYLAASQNFVVEEHREGRFAKQWKVKTIGYAYTLSMGPTDTLLEWHWHPGVGRLEPHIHAHPEDDILGSIPGFSGLHLASGRVPFEAVLRFLISDLGVGGRDGWADVLAEREQIFHEFKSWG